MTFVARRNPPSTLHHDYDTISKGRGGHFVVVAETEMLISLKFSLTVDRRDYIFNPSFCLQNERKDANDG
jgi:hypothetical protein